MTSEQKLTLKLLRAAICGKSSPVANISADTWHEIVRIADQNAILPLLYDCLEPLFSQMRHEDRKFIQERTLVCVRQFYYLSYMAANVLRGLWQAGIEAVVFKGVSAAAWYPVPAYRKSGDIDLFLLRQNDLERSVPVLEQFGFHRQPRQTTVYHVVFENEKGLELELHVFLTEPFESGRTNRAIRAVQESGALGVRERRAEGETFETFGDAGEAFSLIVHMLHHFVRSGFGLKFLADWAVFWNRHPDREDPVKKEYHELICACGIEGFSAAVTGVCERFLRLDSPGLDSTDDAALCAEFIEDVFHSGEFGEEDPSRMVALGGEGPASYLAEFHHRMKLNFPNASRFWILYPVLWARTLFRFLNNNRTVRHTSLRRIMKQARRRGEMSERMHLFDR